MKKQSLSVVIPFYNEEKVIAQCLESLVGQTLKPKEVLLVDDRSTDHTLGKIRVFLNRQSTYQLINSSTHSGAGAARNVGAARATGDILVFVDADMRFHPNFLEELTKPIQEGTSKGTFSKHEFISNWDNRCARFWNYWRGLYEPIAVPKNFPNHSPTFRAILRSEFEHAGKFDEKRGYNDDWSLSEKLGYAATETPARFFHENPSSLGEAFLQARWSGKRRYRWSWIGILGAVIRSNPLWSVPLLWYNLWKKRDILEESIGTLVFFSPIFFFTVQTAQVLGIIEFALMKTPQK